MVTFFLGLPAFLVVIILGFGGLPIPGYEYWSNIGIFIYCLFVEFLAGLFSFALSGLKKQGRKFVIASISIGLLAGFSVLAVLLTNILGTKPGGQDLFYRIYYAWNILSLFWGAGFGLTLALVTGQKADAGPGNVTDGKKIRTADMGDWQHR